jgi:hypothetical protein
MLSHGAKATCFFISIVFYAARILMPHHTTAIAIAMLAAVRAFSKADEAIIMLSFAYPERNLFDSTVVAQRRESNHQQFANGLVQGNGTFCHSGLP